MPHGKEGVVSSNLTGGFPETPANNGERTRHKWSRTTTDTTKTSVAPAPDSATLHLRDAITAYANQDERTALTHLGEAWRLSLPALRTTIRGRIRQPERRDDAEQEGFLKALTAVRNYNHAEHGDVRNAEAFFRWATNLTALNVVERRDRDHEREAGGGALDNEEQRDILEYRADQLRGGNTLDETKAIADYARLVHERAGTPHRARIWTAIVLAVGEGLSERADIARYIHDTIGVRLSDVNIRREAYHMVRSLPHPRDAMNKLEQLVDWRTLDPSTTDEAQFALFDYQWQEIV